MDQVMRRTLTKPVMKMRTTTMMKTIVKMKLDPGTRSSRK